MQRKLAISAAADKVCLTIADFRRFNICGFFVAPLWILFIVHANYRTPFRQTAHENKLQRIAATYWAIQN